MPASSDIFARRGDIAAVSIGNALDWFEIVVYGYFAGIISTLFFPADTPGISLLLAFLTFGVTVLISPARCRCPRRLRRLARPQGGHSAFDRADGGRVRRNRFRSRLSLDRHSRSCHSGRGADGSGICRWRRVRQRHGVSCRKGCHAARVFRQLAIRRRVLPACWRPVSVLSSRRR